MEYDYPRLCGGTFFTLLLTVSRNSVQSDSDEDESTEDASTAIVLEDLMRVADVNNNQVKAISRQTGNYFKNCSRNPSKTSPFNESDFYDVYDVCVTGEEEAPKGYWDCAKAMEDFTKMYLNISTDKKMKALVRAVLKLIQQDRSIPDDGFTKDNKPEMFYICPDGEPVKKKDMLQMDKFYLPCFLTGIWHFIIVNRRKDNKIGRPTIEQWNVPVNDKKHEEEFQNFIFTAADGYKDVDVITDLPDKQQECLDAADSESVHDNKSAAADNKRASDPAQDEAEYETIEGEVVNDGNSNNRENSSDQDKKRDDQGIHIQIGKFIKGDDKSFNIGTINGPIIYHQGDS